MSKARSGNNNGAPPLTVGVIVSSLPPSEFKSLLGVIITVLITVFCLGAWVTNTANELDRKTREAQAGAEQLKDTNTHINYQNKIDNLTAERDFWKAQVERIQSKTGTSVGEHPEKEPSLIIKAPKSGE